MTYLNILIVMDALLPIKTYGGTERVIWYLAHELQKRGHKVTFLAAQGTSCPFAECIAIDHTQDISQQIPKGVNVIHFQNTTYGYNGEIPYIVTCHGNEGGKKDINTVFVSRNHAQRHGSDCFVYNGLDWDDYGVLNTTQNRTFFHFLGKAAWRVKNVRGAIDVARKLPDERLYVLGGTRLNFKMGFRLTLSPKIRFKGMVGGKEKIALLQQSKGLIFPVRWDEPFGLAVTESLYCGAPVFATPYGSLNELITEDVGFLTASKQEMINHITEDYHYTPQRCHEYARDLFSSDLMADKYLKLYERVLNGQTLNPTPPEAQFSFIGRAQDYPFA